MRRRLLQLSGFLMSLVLIIGAGIFLLQNIYHRSVVESMRTIVAPCSQPLAYSIGSFDQQFGISEEEFRTAIAQAEAIWEGPDGQNLFRYDPQGELVINLVYDYRQASTVTLQKLGIEIKGDQASYDALKQKYDAQQKDYTQMKDEYEKMLTQYDLNKNTFESKVDYWNSHGGAPRAEYDQLQAEQKALQKKAAELEALRKRLVVATDAINALVVPLNRLASELNIKAKTYNGVGESVKAAFDEGVYKSDALGTQITIYQFEDRIKLIKVLAHEFGHALGLPHSSDKAAIMYYLNEGTNETLTADDRAALAHHCGGLFSSVPLITK